ncbi:phosphomannomutase [Aureococcus anophagefferens]|uniref:Phosphomannomutase n=1 Tax=Aureococcus anophagefferens TaxID=44056 RepID=A0ABR1GFU6_AURAN
MAAMAPSKRTLALFDIDGTLTPARKTISPEMRAFMQTLRGKITVGVVGGSDFPKQKEQLGEDVTSHKVTLPVKRGTFIEFRTGMLNISPVGRNCSRARSGTRSRRRRPQGGVRKAMVAAMQAEFAHLNLTFSIGGQISFDVFPKGWDKTFCLKFLEPASSLAVHFFGDKTFEGGHSRSSPTRTVAQSKPGTVRRTMGAVPLRMKPTCQPTNVRFVLAKSDAAS